MTVPPTPEELEQQLANLQHQLQEQADQDAAERRQLAATLDDLVSRLASIGKLEQQVGVLQAQLDEARAQLNRSQPSSPPSGSHQELLPASLAAEVIRPNAEVIKPKAVQANRIRHPEGGTNSATAPNHRRRLVGLCTMGLGLLLGMGWALKQQQTPSMSTAAPAAQTATSAVLELRATEPSWLEVRSITGQSLFVGELRGSRRFDLGTGLEVLAGRPDLVTVHIEGTPGRPLGHIEDVIWHRFPPGYSASESEQQAGQRQKQSSQQGD